MGVLNMKGQKRPRKDQRNTLNPLLNRTKRFQQMLWKILWRPVEGHRHNLMRDTWTLRNKNGMVSVTWIYLKALRNINFVLPKSSQKSLLWAVETSPLVKLLRGQMLDQRHRTFNIFAPRASTLSPDLLRKNHFTRSNSDVELLDADTANRLNHSLERLPALRTGTGASKFQSSFSKSVLKLIFSLRYQANRVLWWTLLWRDYYHNDTFH